uniref:Ig-like domain-containing protein n=1 Tax=Esox lucius TaxID=8010 RepID=A0A3P8XGC0_ESOLU
MSVPATSLWFSFYIISKLKPVAVLTLQPNWTQIFTGESITLRCDIQGGGDTDWEYDFYNKGQSVYCDTKSEYTISPAYTSHSGEYRCIKKHRSLQIGRVFQESVQLIQTLLISGAIIILKIVSPQEPLYTGDSVTLQCNIPEYTDWTYVWYRDNQHLPSQTSKTFTISVPDQTGQYQCQGKRTGRPKSSYISLHHPINATGTPLAPPQSQFLVLCIPPELPLACSPSPPLACTPSPPLACTPSPPLACTPV